MLHTLELEFVEYHNCLHLLLVQLFVNFEINSITLERKKLLKYIS